MVSRLDFLESMLEEVRSAVIQFEDALKKDDLSKINKLSKSFQEIFHMVEDSCERKVK